MRVLAEEGVLLALGTVLAVMTGIRTDAVFIAGLLLAVSVTGLVEWLHADERWPWLPCVAYLIVAAAVPAWCSFMAACRLRYGASGCRRAPFAAGDGRALAMGDCRLRRCGSSACRMPVSRPEPQMPTAICRRWLLR